MNTSKTFRTNAGLLFKTLLVAASLFGVVPTRAQIWIPRPPNPESGSTNINPVFANSPAALEIISNLLAQPSPPLSIPILASNTTAGQPGTYWTLEGQVPPMPFNPFVDVPVYEISSNNFLIDDRSVDYGAIQPMDDSTNMPAPLINNVLTFDTNGLWIEVPSNCWAVSNYFTVILHNTVQGEQYDVLTKFDLTDASWATALTVTGAVGNATPPKYRQMGRQHCSFGHVLPIPIPSM